MAGVPAVSVEAQQVKARHLRDAHLHQHGADLAQHAQHDPPTQQAIALLTETLSETELTGVEHP